MDLRAGSLLKKVGLAGFAMAVLAVDAAQAAPRSGVYSSICVQPETDDLDGVGIQLTLDAPPAGIFWLCEGGCGWPQPMTSIHLSGERITFSVADVAVDGQGRTVRSTIYHYRGRFTAQGIRLTSDFPDLGPTVLKRRPKEKPALARSPMAAHNPEATPSAIGPCR